MKTPEQITKDTWAAIHELGNLDPDDATRAEQLRTRIATLVNVLDMDAHEPMLDAVEALGIYY